LLGNIGNVYEELSKQTKDAHKQDSLYALALERYYLSIQIADEIGYKLMMANSRASLASLFIKQNNALQALPLTDTAIAFLTEMHELYYLEGAHRIRSEADSALANWQSASRHFLLYMQYKDSVLGTEMQKEVGRIGKMYEIRVYEKEQESIKKEEGRILALATAKRNRLQYTIIIAVVVVALALTFITLRYYGKHLPPLVVNYAPLFILLIIIETALLFAEPSIELYTAGAPFWKALIFFAIALLFLPFQRLLEWLVSSSKFILRGGGRGRGSGSGSGSSSIFAMILLLSLINACIFNHNDPST